MVSRRQMIAGGLAFGSLGAAGCQMAPRRSMQPPGVPAFSPLRQSWAEEAESIVRSLAEPKIPDQDFPVLPDGVKGKEGDLTAVLSQAIAVAAQSGGGRVIVPPGSWHFVGALRLESGVALHVEAGARLTFAGDPASLPHVHTRWEGIEMLGLSPMIYADKANDVAITGTGVIDAGGERFAGWRKREGRAQKKLRQMANGGSAVEERRFGADSYLRPSFVQIMAGNRILIDGPTFVGAPFWGLHPVYCQNVTIRNIRSQTKSVNTDGIDIDSCDGVLIEGCHIESGDDAIAIKSGRDADGWRVGKPARNVVIRDTRVIRAGTGAVAIGSEISGGVEKVFVHGLVVEQARHGLYIKTNNDRGGFVRQVMIADAVMGAVDTGILITNRFRAPIYGDAPTQLNHLQFAGIRCETAGMAALIDVEHGTGKAITIRSSGFVDAGWGIFARAQGVLSLENVTVNGASDCRCPGAGSPSSRSCVLTSPQSGGHVPPRTQYQCRDKKKL